MSAIKTATMDSMTIVVVPLPRSKCAASLSNSRPASPASSSPATAPAPAKPSCGTFSARDSGRAYFQDHDLRSAAGRAPLDAESADAVRAYTAKKRADADQLVGALEHIAAHGLPPRHGFVGRPTGGQARRAGRPAQHRRLNGLGPGPATPNRHTATTSGQGGVLLRTAQPELLQLLDTLRYQSGPVPWSTLEDQIPSRTPALPWSPGRPQARTRSWTPGAARTDAAFVRRRGCFSGSGAGLKELKGSDSGGCGRDSRLERLQPSDEQFRSGCG